MVLEAHSYVILPVFIIVSLFVIWPIRIPLGRRLTSFVLRSCCKLRIINAYDASDAATSLHFPLDLRTAPVIGVILLVATTTIDGSTIRLGVVGDESIKPYDVLVLFISLAYISIALDGTGALEAVAFWVSKRGGSSGRLLFFYLYAFFLSVGCIVGNDPLILSGTPFLVYLTHHTGLDYEPWVFSEFMAANTASAVLVSSNPTNILITGSFQLNFLTGFTKWTILPSVVPAILNYGIILLMFRKSIPKTIVSLQEDPWSKLRDRTGAIFLTVLMLVTVAVLVGTSFVPNHAVEVWMVTAPAGILAFVYNLVSDWRDQKLRQHKILEQEQDPAAFSGPLDRTGSNISRESPIRRRSSQHLPPTSEKPLTPTALQPSDTADTNKSTSSLSPSTPSSSQPTSLSDLFTTLTTRHPSTTATLNRLPIPLLPFAISFFILVRSLSQHGWIHLFATWYAHICTNPTATVFFTGFLCAAVLCPLAGTNIGATIILVEIIRDKAFMQSDAVVADQRVLWAAVYAVALGSNLGAFSFTFAGSLAGLLWRGLLRDARVGEESVAGDRGRSGGGGVHNRDGSADAATDGRAEAGPGVGPGGRVGGEVTAGGEKTEEGGGIIVSQWRFAKINFFPLILQMGVACAIIVGEVYWFV